MAVPSNVRVGDPIQLVIDIHGSPLDTLAGPDLNANTELTDGFRVPVEELAGTLHGSFKRFTQTIRAQRADLTTIPPIEFAYFDTQAQRYVVERTEPIPILVSVADRLDATDLDLNVDPPRERETELAVRDGLRGNRTDEPRLLASTPRITAIQVAAVTAVPPVAFAMVWCVSALTRRSNERAAQRRRSAFRNAEQRLRRVEAGNQPADRAPGEIEAALASYLADRLDQPPLRFSGTAAIEYLQARGVNPNLVQRWAEVQRRCEEAAYAGLTAADASLTTQARQCIRELEQEPL